MPQITNVRKASNPEAYIESAGEPTTLRNPLSNSNGMRSIEEKSVDSNESHSKKTIESIQVRKSFPETWIFEDFVASEDGENIFSRKVPSTITSWIISGFSLNPSTGIALTQQPSVFKVFMPFFVTTNLPYSIKRGEIVAIPISIFNYLQRDLLVEITLFNQDREFEFIELNEKESRLRRKGEASPDSAKTKHVNVISNDGASVSFMIRPFKVGYCTIKVIATSAVAGDGFERQLLVEPEGITKYVNEAFLIDHDENYELEKEINLIIPPNAIPESIKIQAAATGDIVGPTIENLDKLM